MSDYLSENPDLNRDILDFGERLGLPGVEASPEVGADVVVSPTSGPPGQEVTIRASGHRGETAVTLGAGPSVSESEILERTTTTAGGTVEATRFQPPRRAGIQSCLSSKATAFSSPRNRFRLSGNDRRSRDRECGYRAPLRSANEVALPSRAVIFRAPYAWWTDRTPFNHCSLLAPIDKGFAH